MTKELFGLKWWISIYFHANIILVGTLRKPRSGRYILVDWWFVGIYMNLIESIYIPSHGFPSYLGSQGRMIHRHGFFALLGRAGPWVGRKDGIHRVTTYQSSLTSSQQVSCYDGHMFFWNTLRHLPTKENAQRSNYYCFILLESMLGMLILT